MPEPPDDEVPGVVDRGAGRAGEALLVEPHRLEVERERPPRRRCRVRRGQAVVVVVHLPRELDERLAAMAGGVARPELMVLDRGPRQVAHDVDAERDREQADRRPDDRDARTPSQAAASRSGPAPAGRGPAPGRPASAAGERAVAERAADPERARRPTTEPSAAAIAASNGVTDSGPMTIAVSSLPSASAPKKSAVPTGGRAPAGRATSPRRSRRSGGRPRRRQRAA